MRRHHRYRQRKTPRTFSENLDRELTQAVLVLVRPPTRGGGRLARRSEGRMPSGQPAKPALSEVEGMPALRGSCTVHPVVLTTAVN